MNKMIVSALAVLLSANLCFASSGKKNDDVAITTWLQTHAIHLNLPAFHATKDFNGNRFELKNLLQENPISPAKIQPNENSKLNLNGKEVAWHVQNTNSDGSISLPNKENLFYYFVAYANTSRWSKFDLKLNGYPMVEVYVDGEKKLSHLQHETKNAADLSENLILEQGHHSILVKVLSGKKNNKFSVSLTAQDTPTTGLLHFSLSPKQVLDIHKVLDARKVKSTALSFDGKLALITYSRTLPPSDKTESWSEIQELTSGKIIHSFRGSQLSNMAWLPKGNKISYTKTYNKKTSFFIFDFDKGTEKEVVSGLADFGSYTWAPTGKYVIYSVTKDYSKEWKLRKIQGMEDRLPWFRTRSFLYQLDSNSGMVQRLSFGTLSTILHDISPDGTHILFSQSHPDYKKYPYEKQNLYEMNMETFKIDTIWKDKKFSGSAQYSPDGKKLLVQGGPSCFGTIGENIGKQPLANNFDGQLYIFNLASKKAEPLTLHFNPSVNSASWNKADGNIYINTANKDYVQMYRYRPNAATFEKLNIQADVVRNFKISANGKNLSYTACSISSPYKAFVYNLQNNTSTLLANPQQHNLQNVEFGNTADWNFTKANGDTIIGRVYYPPHFDSKKKYPLIVNYYAGTLPVERSYGGRYPLNLYAAMGYVVYLLQPSGAVGFGQEFSARHQNNWGITTADEIIEGTKKFLKAHPFVDSHKIGCIGASYGGFMTMLLQTKTDLFSAAISHAGISSIASYWGEGYWGYSYSVNASGKSFPWNNRKLYINQSALFNADKINTPMLLLHGSIDTNVPLGESIQLYQALKLLGKDVDFVEVKDQDHHILNYTKRILWNNTIFAYFAKYLKDQPEWWNNLYPDKNL